MLTNHYEFPSTPTDLKLPYLDVQQCVTQWEVENEHTGSVFPRKGRTPRLPRNMACISSQDIVFLRSDRGFVRTARANEKKYVS